MELIVFIFILILIYSFKTYILIDIRDKIKEILKELKELKVKRSNIGNIERR